MNNRSVVLACTMFATGGICSYLITPSMNKSKDNDAHEIALDVQTYSQSDPTGPVGNPGAAALQNPFSKTEYLSVEATEEKDIFPQLVVSEMRKEKTGATAEGLINELTLVSNWEQLEQVGLEEIADTETSFLQTLEQSPELVKPLLTAYSEMKNSSAKEFLRSMLTASGALEVEQHALTEVVNTIGESQAQWINLLAGIGVNSTASREVMFLAMDGMSDIDNLTSALHAFAPDTVSEIEKTQVAGRLEYYTNHLNDSVRGAAIEALSKWVDKDNSYFIETALNDESEVVRRSAVFSAYTSGIQSESIKTGLIRMLEDETQPYDLRLDVFSALSTYSLQGDEFQKYHKFSTEVEVLYSGSGNAKG